MFSHEAATICEIAFQVCCAGCIEPNMRGGNSLSVIVHTPPLSCKSGVSSAARLRWSTVQQKK